MVPARGRHLDDAVRAGEQVPPERVEVGRAGETAGGADDRDPLVATRRRRDRGGRWRASGDRGRTGGRGFGLGLRTVRAFRSAPAPRARVRAGGAAVEGVAELVGQRVGELRQRREVQQQAGIQLLVQCCSICWSSSPSMIDSTPRSLKSVAGSSWSADRCRAVAKMSTSHAGGPSGFGALTGVASGVASVAGRESVRERAAARDARLRHLRGSRRRAARTASRSTGPSGRGQHDGTMQLRPGEHRLERGEPRVVGQRADTEVRTRVVRADARRRSRATAATRPPGALDHRARGLPRPRRRCTRSPRRSR